MKNSRKLIARLATGASLAVLATSPTIALAQENSAAEGQGKADSAALEIVVTGTLIRGTEAVGTQTIAIDEKALDQAGANTTNELLRQIPQITNTFNGRSEGDPRGAISGGISITRPNLRRLPGFNAASGSTTLVLVDGFRIAPVGVYQAAVDVDIIPSAVLEGVDVLTDGGTSLYGADAVAGVLNFRTKRNFKGLEMEVNYGLGTTISSYDEFSTSITAGTSWNGGNAYLSFGYSRRSEILNGDVDYVLPQIFNSAGEGRFYGAQCPSPVGGTNTYVYVVFGGRGFMTTSSAVGGGFTAVGQPCDSVSANSFQPENRRYSLYGAVSQEIGDNVDLRVTGYFTKRDQDFSQFARGFTTRSQPQPAIPPGAINRVTKVIVDAGTSFSFSPNSGYVDDQFEVGFDTWGITPELTFGLPSDFQGRLTATVGGSTNYQRRPNVNGILAQASVDARTLDPFNVAAANPALVSQILDYEDAIDTKHDFYAVRLVVDGPLFTLPGGEARIAVGGEYLNNRASSRSFTGAVNGIDGISFGHARQTDVAFFAELNLPLIKQLEVSASVRRDEYSDFGSTTNPNIGVNFTPTSWLKIFGHWNTSFNAPTAVDQVALAIGRFTAPIYSASSPPNDPFGEYTGGSRAFLLEGPGRNLKPQEAESWAIGADITPVSNFTFGAQYYRIDFTNVLGAVDSSDQTTFTTNADLYYYSPDNALYESFLAQIANGDLIRQQLQAQDIGLIVDRRTTNLSSALIEGVDFHAKLDVPVSFGEFSFGVNGNVQTKSEVETNGTVRSNLQSAPDYTASVTATFNSGGFSSRLTVNRSGPTDDVGTDFTGATVGIGNFTQANLFLGYEIPEGNGALTGTTLRIVVDNLFDASPEIIRRGNQNANSYESFTLGRVFKFGISKKF